MRISKNISFKKVSVEDIEKLYRLDNFKQPIKDINPNEHSIIIELPKENDLNEKFIGEPKELKEQSVKRIYLEEVKEKMKSLDSIVGISEELLSLLYTLRLLCY